MYLYTVMYMYLYNDVNAKPAVIGRCLRMDDVTGRLLSLFCSTWRTVLKMFVRSIRIEPSLFLPPKAYI